MLIILVKALLTPSSWVPPSPVLILLTKENIDEFNDITYTCVYIMANLSNLLNPFMPSSANKIKDMLNLDEYKWEEYNLKGNLKINNLDLLFTRMD